MGTTSVVEAARRALGPVGVSESDRDYGLRHQRDDEKDARHPGIPAPRL
jgi:hypothetical protein